MFQSTSRRGDGRNLLAFALAELGHKVSIHLPSWRREEPPFAFARATHQAFQSTSRRGDGRNAPAFPASARSRRFNPPPVVETGGTGYRVPVDPDLTVSIHLPSWRREEQRPLYCCAQYVLFQSTSRRGDGRNGVATLPTRGYPCFNPPPVVETGGTWRFVHASKRSSFQSTSRRGDGRNQKAQMMLHSASRFQSTSRRGDGRNRDGEAHRGPGLHVSIHLPSWRREERRPRRGCSTSSGFNPPPVVETGGTTGVRSKARFPMRFQSTSRRGDGRNVASALSRVSNRLVSIHLPSWRREELSMWTTPRTVTCFNPPPVVETGGTTTP